MQSGVFAAFWRRGLLAYDAVSGIDWTWMALDGAMGKAPLGGGKNRPQPDRPTAMRSIVGRAKCGSKRSVLSDGHGVPVAGVLDGANRVEPRGSPDNDHKLMRETLDAIALPRPKPASDRPQHLCLDKGYDYAEPREIAAEFGFTLHLRTRGEEVTAKRHAGAKARRWVVECTHSWVNRFRAILIRWNKKPKNHPGLLHFAFGIITWRHALPG